MLPAIRSLLALGLMALLLALPLRSGLAKPPLEIEAEASWIAPTNVILVIWLSYGVPPVQMWFELGRRPDLADAQFIGTTQRDDGRGNIVANAPVRGLALVTDYYFRGHVRMANGHTATTQTEHFRTRDPATAPALKCRYASHEPAEKNGSEGLAFTFLCSGNPWFSGTAHLMASRDPAMMNALSQDRAVVKYPPPELDPEKVRLFFAYDDWPDGAVAYVQVATETWWGNGRSEIVGVEVKRNRPHKRPDKRP